MNPSPMLTIGMPVFNGASYAKEAIESILEQDADLELVISDNGSTDETEQICRDYAAKDQRVRYFRYKENRGAAWNYNNTFKLSKGKYFKWAAYDDKLAPEFCARCLEILESSPDVVLAYPKAVVIDGNAKFVRYDSDRLDLTDSRPHSRFRKFFDAYKGHNICNPVFGVFRSDVLRRTRLIGNFLTSDRILLGEITLHGKIKEVPEHLFYYRFHPSNSMSGYSAAERILWFDPSNKGRLCLLTWTWFCNWSDSITKAPLSWGERVKCSLQLYRWALENLPMLSKELLKGVLWPVLRRTSFYRSRDMGF